MRLLRFVKVNAQEYRIGGAFTFSIGIAENWAYDAVHLLAFYKKCNILFYMVILYEAL